MYYRLNDKEWRCLTVTPRGEVLTQYMIQSFILHELLTRFVTDCLRKYAGFLETKKRMFCTVC